MRRMFENSLVFCIRFKSGQHNRASERIKLNWRYDWVHRVKLLSCMVSFFSGLVQLAKFYGAMSNTEALMVRWLHGGGGGGGGRSSYRVSTRNMSFGQVWFRLQSAIMLTLCLVIVAAKWDFLVPNLQQQWRNIPKWDRLFCSQTASKKANHSLIYLIFVDGNRCSAQSTYQHTLLANATVVVVM